MTPTARATRLLSGTSVLGALIGGSPLTAVGTAIGNCNRSQFSLRIRRLGCSFAGRGRQPTGGPDTLLAMRTVCVHRPAVAVVSLLLGVVAPASSGAQTVFESVGERALGMAGAFVAVA